jgi:hypothetical protein
MPPRHQELPSLSEMSPLERATERLAELAVRYARARLERLEQHQLHDCKRDRERSVGNQNNPESRRK